MKAHLGRRSWDLLREYHEVFTRLKRLQVKAQKLNDAFVGTANDGSDLHTLIQSMAEMDLESDGLSFVDDNVLWRSLDIDELLQGYGYVGTKTK